MAMSRFICNHVNRSKPYFFVSGESVADTSTSSPDLVPLSPKMSCEGRGSPESRPGGGDVGVPLPSPGLGPGPGPPRAPTPSDASMGPAPVHSPSPIPVSSPPYISVSSSMCGPGVIRSVASCSVIKSEGSPRQLNTVHVKREPIEPRPTALVSHSSRSPRSPRPPMSPVSPQSHQHHVWVQANRINGVKPELIGGNFPPAGLMHESRVPRNAPTVIMGESGGVRTMFWSPATPAPVPAVSEASSIGGPSRSPRPVLPQVRTPFGHIFTFWVRITNIWIVYNSLNYLVRVCIGLELITTVRSIENIMSKLAIVFNQVLINLSERNGIVKN